MNLIILYLISRLEISCISRLSTKFFQTKHDVMCIYVCIIIIIVYISTLCVNYKYIYNDTFYLLIPIYFIY